MENGEWKMENGQWTMLPRLLQNILSVSYLTYTPHFHKVCYLPNIPFPAKRAPRFQEALNNSSHIIFLRVISKILRRNSIPKKITHSTDVLSKHTVFVKYIAIPIIPSVAPFVCIGTAKQNNHIAVFLI